MKITSRRDDPKEISEMESFRDAANGGVLPVSFHIESLYYDSKQCVCAIKIRNGSRPNKQTDKEILFIGKKHLSQFEYKGIIYHGERLHETS